MPETPPPAGDWRVTCLCAQWCRVCREYQPLFEAVAREHPGVRFAWVDVEDQAEAMGEVDIETFPTLLIAQGGAARFLGPVEPAPAALSRLLAGLMRDAGGAAAPQANALLARLAALEL